MRVRTALAILIAVNLVWAAAFFGYVRRSTTPVIKPGPDMASLSKPPTATQNLVSASTAMASLSTNTPGAAAHNATNAASRGPRSLASGDKKFGWQDVTNETYLDYVARLRAVGCPEKQIRSIVIADVNELFDQRRLEHAIKTDSQWWKAETFMGVLPMQNFSANFDEPRRELLGKILGEESSESVKLPTLNASAVNLTGPVLGALPPETWNTVQEICARSMDRHQSYQMARINEGAPMDNVELAKLRDLTRTDLAKVLTPEELEEFLLRFSHNSSKLRTDIRGIDISPDEFRKFFRAIDPLEHRTQIDYGGPEALSPKQREQLEAQRDRAAREALTPEHYLLYMATKDPLYKQAQLMAMQYGLNGKAVQPLHDMQKSLDARRTQISQNAGMTPEQKAQALQSISIEHQQMLQQILGNVTYRQ